MPARRVVRSLADLRRRLPPERSLSELRIVADGDQILVYEGDAPYEIDTGQFVLDFRVSDLAARVAPLHEAAVPDLASEVMEDAESWYILGTELEESVPARAQAAYGEAVTRNPGHADARVNLGRLLHEAGRAAEAADHYRRALEANPAHATAAFNLGVAMEDLRQWREAERAYSRAIRLQPALADAHYNLASVFERLGDRQAALRSLRRYRDLTSSPAAR